MCQEAFEGTGKDGHARGVILKVAARGEQATTLQRPLQLLYPLEIHCSTSGDKQPKDKRIKQNPSPDNQAAQDPG